MKLLKQLSLTGLTAAVLALAASNASANVVWNFSFSGNNVSGSGQIDTADYGTAMAVTDVTGTVFDSDIGTGPFDITGLSGYAGADNTLYLQAPFVDMGGISFTTIGGGDFNLGLGGGGPYGLVLNASDLNAGGWGNGGGVLAGSTDISLDVPEPSSMALFGIALLALATLRRKRD
jgi:hypothetical protein